jgi:hypothetical protein
MADETTTAPRSRRALLTGAAATAAALAASAALPLGVSAADPDDVVKGQDNATTDTTSITNSADGSAALAGAQTGTSTAEGVGFGSGVQGTSLTGAGVFAWSVSPPDDSWFVQDYTAHTGVFGSAPEGDLVTSFGTGVWGDSPNVGVYGSGAAGVYGFGGNGVIGESAGTGAAVLAIASAATNVALEVQGKVKFSRSGRATLGAGKSSIKVTLAGTTTSSRVFAVLHSNRTGRWVQSVVPTTGSFTIYLNGTVSASTYIAWFVIN